VKLIAIENILISDDVVREQFVCDLAKCKGGCCEDGDAGAPLTEEETDEINKAYEAVLPYLSEEGRLEIEKKGRYVYDAYFGWVTPTIGGHLCVYGKKDQRGIIQCGFEQAFLDGRSDWKKPISCHLYPIKTKKAGGQEFVNYEPRETLCQPGCQLGKKLKLPVYVFLKEALIRKFGKSFYETLEQVARKYYGEKTKESTVSKK
jgi:hypothetical protein